MLKLNFGKGDDSGVLALAVTSTPSILESALSCSEGEFALALSKYEIKIANMFFYF